MSQKIESIKKQDLVDAVAESANLTKIQAKVAIDSVFDSIVSFLLKGHVVPVNNFGKFSPSERKARTGVNPSNGQKIKIDASKSVSFKASSALKDQINK